MKKIIFIISSVIILTNCAHKKSMRQKALDDFYNGKIESAEEKILSKEVLEEERSKILTLFDLGIFAHNKKQFEKSNKFFFMAKELAKNYYTKSIKQAIASGLLNDTKKDYPGMDYEISLVHYYIVLNFINLAQAGKSLAWKIPLTKVDDKIIFPEENHPERILSKKEISSFYQMAKSEVLAWDSFLETVRNQNRGEPYYKDDILAKTLGAYIHRLIGRSSDFNTAKILYNDAQKLLVKSYSVYPTFNEKHNSFQENYSKFPQIELNTVKKEYIKKTKYFKSLNKLIKDSKKNINKKSTVLAVIELGMIPKKFEKKHGIGLQTIFSGIKDDKTRRVVEEIGIRTILQIAPMLGVGMVAAGAVGYASSSEDDKPKHMSESLDKAIGFEFKLPSIPKVPTNVELKLSFKTSNGRTYHLDTTTVNPLNDIANLNVNRRAFSVATKTGIRVGLKYLSALIPAIILYKATERKAGPIAARFAALASWIAAKKALDATEKADIRAWNSLPMLINMGEINLPHGLYEVKATSISNGEIKEHKLGSLRINNDLQVFQKRIFKINSQKSTTK